MSGLTVTSAPVTFEFTADPPRVWLLPEDRATLGHWERAYGGQYEFIPGVSADPSSNVSIVSDAAVKVLGLSDNPAALQSNGVGFASVLHRPGELEITLRTPDHLVRQGALYFADWLAFGRRQTISFFADGADVPLATTEVDAGNGTYFVFCYRAPIRVRIANAAGDAYLSGLFIDQPAPISLQLTAPVDGIFLRQPASLPIAVSAVAAGREVTSVEVWNGNAKIAGFSAPPYAITLTNVLSGEYELRASAQGEYGYAAVTEPIHVTVLAPPAKASFLGMDTNSMGSWRLRYGRDGYWLVGDAYQMPERIQIAPENHFSYVFTDDSSEPEALERPFHTKRFAHCFYGNPDFSMAVTPLDGRPARIGFYMLDYLNSHRAMDILVEDLKGTVLDRREVRSFGKGQYFFWEIQGEVRFRFHARAYNAVVSAIFLDDRITAADLARNNALPPDRLPPAAALIDSDGDGVLNGTEYFLGFNPLDPEDTPHPNYAAANGRLTITFVKRGNPEDARLVFRGSTDLRTWSDLAPASVTFRTVGARQELAFHFNLAGTQNMFVTILPQIVSSSE
jgi:hypothetical protein